MKKQLLAVFTWFALLGIYSVFLVSYVIVVFLGWLMWNRSNRRKGTETGGYHLLVIGTFYTRNWCIAHISPLAQATSVRTVTAVVDGPTKPFNNVRFVPPPSRLVFLVGRAFAKYYCAIREALREKPDLVMGYHLLPGAMTALLVARLVGAKAGYQLTAGPIELIGGGAATENFLLKNLGNNSRLLEYLACRIAHRFDLLVVRGAKGREFLIRRGMRGLVRIVPGSLDPERFAPAGEERCYDVISVCRLVGIKQPDHIVEVLARLRALRPEFKALILGDGPKLEELKSLADRLGVSDSITFKGHVEDVDQYLKRSKVFLLTSRSEGLSIAMAEAMASGVVPVVADVGELSDLVHNGETGWVVPGGAFDVYAQRIAEILQDSRLFDRLSSAARSKALRHNGIATVAARWTRTLTDVCGANFRRASSQTARASVFHQILGGMTRRRLWEHTPQMARDLMSPLARRCPPGFWLGRAFRRELAFLDKAQWWSAEQFREYQLVHLQSMCRLAYERTTYYYDRFNDIGFEPGDLKTLEDLSRLPTIDAQTLRDHAPRMYSVAEGLPGTEYVSTGGTSGAPLRFRIGAERSAVEYAYLALGWQRAGYDLNLPQAVFRGETVRRDATGLRHKYDPILRRHYYSNFHMTDENMRHYMAHVATIGPCFLHAYPSSALALARFIERSRTAVPSNIRGVLVGSENVYSEERSYVEQTLGVRYFSWYGHTEKVVLAAECEQSSNYHVWPTYGYFELLDEDGNPVTRPGQRGEIVGTGFINTVMPFIRYRTGDHAVYWGDSCKACGRQHPTIREIRGHRTHEMLVASDGSLISWTALNMHDQTFDQVRQFQFYQDTRGKAVLSIVPTNGFDESAKARIHRSLQHKLDYRLDVKIELADSISLSVHGKMHYVDQRLDLERIALDGNVP